MQSQQQQQQFIGSPAMVSLNGQTIPAACQWLASSSTTSINQLATNKPKPMQPELESIDLVPHEETRSGRSRSSSKSSRSRSSSRSTESFQLDRESDLSDLVDRFRQQSRRANHHQQALLQTTSADAHELVSALQDHLKSAVAAAAAAAAVSTASSLVAPYQYPPDGDRFQLHQQHQLQQPQQQNQVTAPKKIESTIRQDFAPLDLKILHDYDWQDLTQFSGTTSRSSRSPSSSPRIGLNQHEAEPNIEVDELETTTDRVQRTEIVQTLANELQHEPNNNFKRDRGQNETCCVPQNLVAMSTSASSSTSTSLLAPMRKQNKIKQNTNISSSNDNGSTRTHTTATSSNQASQGSQANNDLAQRQKRMFKCRHCPFETDQKVENWLHIRIHMRPERLLSCNSCEFVTEYKHHLEYHQRNHTGYKPFKCPHCDYTCVNNSMLNSHMKSHSTVYQYQCGDCKYATKYVHSLKMHLRKYQHQPAEYMIDIFARKRGPKPGSGRKQQLLKQQELERQIREQVEQQRALQALQGTSAPSNVRRGGGGGGGGGGSKRSRQSQAQQKKQLEQQQQCILDLRVGSKLTK